MQGSSQSTSAAAASRRSPRSKRVEAPSMSSSALNATLPAAMPLRDVTLSECEACVKCIASFEAVASPRSIVNCHLYPTVPRMPSDSAKAFNVSHLSAFCQEKRTSPAEFSHDLLSRMIAAASPGQVIDAATLRTAASSGAFAADWKRVIRMASEHTARALFAQAHKDHAMLRVRPPTIPRTPRSARGTRITSISSTASENWSASRPHSTERSARGASASSPRSARGGHSLINTGGDEFRDADGRRRLFLPAVPHPSWSLHADGIQDGFDQVRCDATGRSLRDAQHQAIAYEVGRFANSGTHRQVYDCGRALEIGNTHKTVARGATVVDLSRLVNVSFNPYFSEKTVANQKLPMSSAMVSRNVAVPPTIRSLPADSNTTQRINESIAAVVEYLDAVAR